MFNAFALYTIAFSLLLRNIIFVRSRYTYDFPTCAYLSLSLLLMPLFGQQWRSHHVPILQSIAYTELQRYK